VDVIISDEQFRDPEFQGKLAEACADKFAKDLSKIMDSSLGAFFPIPISMAKRLSGYSECWIRRNLPIIKTEGQVDSIQFVDLQNAINMRKVSKC